MGDKGGVANGSAEPDVHNGDSIVIEDCRDIFRGELVRRVADEQTCLSDRTVTDDNAPKQYSLVSNKPSLSGCPSIRDVVEAAGRVLP